MGGISCAGSRQVTMLCGWSQPSVASQLFCYYRPVAQLCPTLWDPLDCSIPGLPVPHHLPELAQVQVHCISDAIQSSHPLMPSSPSSFIPQSIPKSVTLPMSQLFASVQFSSVAQSCLTLCSPMDCSTPGLPVHHQLPELAQTHVHWVSDAIQLSDPLSPPSPPAVNLSQDQGLFQWVSSLH